MSRKKRGKDEPPVEPDLPITPMLDMSFQLMAFFIFTFHPAPTEGQIAMALPKEEGGASDVAPSITDDKPVNYVVRVEATENGKIASMAILVKDAGDSKPEPIGAEIKQYRDKLKLKIDELKGKPSKLTLEIGEGLLEEYVVTLLDIGLRAGFTEIAPVPLNSKLR